MKISMLTHWKLIHNSCWQDLTGIILHIVHGSGGDIEWGLIQRGSENDFTLIVNLRS